MKLKFLLLGILAIYPISFVYPDPIPASILFLPPHIEDILLSPDGEQISYIAKDNNKVKNIFIKTMGKNNDAPILPNLESDIISHSWSFLHGKILFFQQTDDKKAIHLFLVDISSKLVRDLTPYKGINAKFLITDHRRPEEIVCGIELNKKGRFDLYSINILSGAIVEVAKLPEDTISVKGDLLNKVFISESIDRKSHKSVFKIKTAKNDKFIDFISVEKSDFFEVIDFSEDGRSIYALSNLNRNFISLIRFDIENNKEIEMISTIPKFDITFVFFDHYAKRPIATAYDFMKREFNIIDSNYNEDFQVLLKLKKGNITKALNDIKNEKWLLSLESGDLPPSYYIYDRQQRRTSFLFLSNPEFDKYKTFKSQPFTIRFNESEKLLLFVTLPNEQSAENFPLVLNLVTHEKLRQGINFDPICQFFSSRGFACISFNHSGIVGLGKDFYLTPFTKEGAKRREEEIRTVIKWAIDRNIANPQQIIIISNALNSLYILSSLTNSKDIHTSIFIEPLLDMKRLKENLDISRFDVIRHYFLAPFEDKKGLLESLSKITIPCIFMLNKKSNLYEPKEMSEKLLELQKSNKSVSMFIYPDDRLINYVDFYQRVESLLARYYNTDYLEAKTELKIEVDIR